MTDQIEQAREAVERLPFADVCGSGTYGIDGHRKFYGNGDNLLRTTTCAQPRALAVGDVLATGERVSARPRQGFNGAVWVQLTNERGAAHWIDLPGRIPVALQAAHEAADALAAAGRLDPYAIAERFVSESSTLPLPEHGDDELNDAEKAIVEELAQHLTRELALAAAKGKSDAK